MGDTMSGSFTSFALKQNAEVEFRKEVEEECLRYGWKPILWKRGVEGKVKKIGTRILDVDESMLKVARSPEEIAAKINELAEFADKPAPRHPQRSIDEVLAPIATDQGRLEADPVDAVKSALGPALIVAGENSTDVENLDDSESDLSDSEDSDDVPAKGSAIRCSVCGTPKASRSVKCAKGCKPGAVRKQEADTKFEKRMAKVTPAIPANKRKCKTSETLYNAKHACPVCKPRVRTNERKTSTPAPMQIAKPERNTLLDLIADRQKVEEEIELLNRKMGSINRQIVEACGGVMPEPYPATPPPFKDSTNERASKERPARTIQKAKYQCVKCGASKHHSSAKCPKCGWSNQLTRYAKLAK